MKKQNKKPWIYFSLIIIILVLIISKKNKTDLIEISEETMAQNPELCYQLNENSAGLNIIFYSDNYDENEFLLDVGKSIKYIDGVEPFSKYHINYYVLENNNEICKKRTKDYIKPILECDSEKLNQYIKQCGLNKFKLIILSKEDFWNHASIATYENSVMFISKKMFNRNNFLHEFGHLFGLRDEFAPIQVKARSIAWQQGPNCVEDVETAKKKWGDVKLYNGCAGHENYLKPHSTSLMSRTAIGDYSYSENYLNTLLQCCFYEGKCNDLFILYPETKGCLY